MSRPYRLWDAQMQCDVRWAYYSDRERAHRAALLHCNRWAKIGTTIQVYHKGGRPVQKGSTYVRTVHGVRMI
jgi:hypothetical protein